MSRPAEETPRVRVVDTRIQLEGPARAKSWAAEEGQRKEERGKEMSTGYEDIDANDLWHWGVMKAS